MPAVPTRPRISSVRTYLPHATSPTHSSESAEAICVPRANSPDSSWRRLAPPAALRICRTRPQTSNSRNNPGHAPRETGPRACARPTRVVYYLPWSVD
ncbi:hypothetical protein HYPSUDRAFT_64703 [Hypholoma sublateritium FD-334 SS-4]|uniref:Uncharacterized protein n=1 Tax=Hypholoma sublateritium (strain FD-334 SS-4) TaxID=945553 RepID=A0A0D2Q1U2_HYPSF|nr:hypothetical protein HYPSUDRAFT_64703 [Hypholoma sublateritium FD-334 SS-4]